ncbi:MAG TPA: IclR family transcriptional regulator [Rhizobiales bacterium]|nr:IclR family transcriptional regulator [Hyphomicrobiales bacterium]
MASGKDSQEKDFTVASKESLRAAGQVQSVTRAMTLLNALSYFSQGLTLSELAKKVGLANSTAHRLLTTLQNERFVRFDAERSAWLIGVQAFRVGSAFVRSRDVVTIARPFMRLLMQKEGETVSLAVEDRGEVVYLSQVETQQMMRAICGPGGRASMHSSGIGKALLAAYPQEQLQRVMPDLTFNRQTSHTLTTPEEFSRELKKIRDQGYAVDDEEVAVGLRCVAAAIYDENSFPLAGLSLSGPTARIPRERLAGLGQTLRAVARDITEELGGVVPQTEKGSS